MQCSLFQSLVNQTVESHSDAVSPEVRTHGSDCSNEACRQAWAEYSLLSQAVAQWRAGLPQVDLTDRVLSDLCPAEPSAVSIPEVRPTLALTAFVEQSWHDFRSPTQRPWAIALSLVAVLLLVGTLIVSIPHTPHAEVVVRQRHNPVLTMPREQLATRSPDSPNVAVTSVEWAQKASTVVANAIVSIPERGADWVPSHSWDVDWQHKLEPIRRDAHAAWDALLDEIPMPNQPPS